MSDLHPINTRQATQRSKTEYRREQDLYSAQLAQIIQDKRAQHLKQIFARMRSVASKMKAIAQNTKTAPKDRSDIETNVKD